MCGGGAGRRGASRPAAAGGEAQRNQEQGGRCCCPLHLHHRRGEEHRCHIVKDSAAAQRTQRPRCGRGERRAVSSPLILRPCLSALTFLMCLCFFAAGEVRQAQRRHRCRLPEGRREKGPTSEGRDIRRWKRGSNGLAGQRGHRAEGHRGVSDRWAATEDPPLSPDLQRWSTPTRGAQDPRYRLW